jgi:hypothetical protein
MSSVFVFDLDCMDPGSFSGVDDMLAATCLYGASVRWRGAQ